jgi:hypothetical protein
VSSKVSRTASKTVTGGLHNLGKLRIAGVASISLVGLIHLLVTPEYYGFAAYLGLLMIANLAGSIVSAVGIYQGRVWGWWLGAVMAAGAFLAYIGAGRWGCPDCPLGSPLRSHRAFSPSLWKRSFWGWPYTCSSGRERVPLPPAELCNTSYNTMSLGSLRCFDLPTRRQTPWN